MKAARIHAYGDIDQIRIEDVAKPAPAAGQILVKVEASSLNPVELYVRQGYLAKDIPLAFPVTMGLDLAGTVEEIGSGVTEFAVGDRVIGKLPIDGNGSNAEYIVTTPDRLAPLHDDLDFKSGAVLPLAALTGWQAVDALGVKPDDRVLVTGALGAVGRAATQRLKALGAVPVAGIRAARFPEAADIGIKAIAIEEHGDPRSYDAAVDTVGGAIAARAIALVKDGGKVATVVSVPDNANADGRVTVTNVWAQDKGDMLREIAIAAGSGDLSIPIAHTFKLSEVAEGHKTLGAGKVGGKIVFVP